MPGEAACRQRFSLRIEATGNPHALKRRRFSFSLETRRRGDERFGPPRGFQQMPTHMMTLTRLAGTTPEWSRFPSSFHVVVRVVSLFPLEEFFLLHPAL